MENNITIFTTPTCPYCEMLKRYLDQNDIKYKVVDVSVDQKAAEEMQSKSGQLGVPVMINKKDGKEDIIVGFDKEKVDQSIGLVK